MTVEEVRPIGASDPPPVAGQRARGVDVLLGQRAVVRGVDQLAGLGDDVHAFVRPPARAWRSVAVGEPAHPLHGKLTDRVGGQWRCCRARRLCAARRGCGGASRDREGRDREGRDREGRHRCRRWRRRHRREGRHGGRADGYAQHVAGVDDDAGGGTVGDEQHRHGDLESSGDAGPAVARQHRVGAVGAGPGGRAGKWTTGGGRRSQCYDGNRQQRRADERDDDATPSRPFGSNSFGRHPSASTRAAVPNPHCYLTPHLQYRPFGTPP